MSQPVEVKKDRAPKTFVSGSPKKGGAGGKGTWGVGGLDDLQDSPVDRNDPNYDSEDDQGGNVELKPTMVRHEGLNNETSQKLEEIIAEYFSSGEISDLLTSLEELRESKYPHFVKKLIVSAMDKDAAQRELASKLVAKLEPKVSQDAVQLGFQMAVDSLEDISLDVPDAPSVLSKFIARAVYDEVLPPAFLKHATSSSNKSDICLRLANAFSNERFRADKLKNIWGPGNLCSYKKMRKEANLIFQEFLDHRNAGEATTSVRQLKAPDFHFQVVREGLRVALEKENSDREAVLGLLKNFSESGLISSSQFSHGFEVSFKSLDDLKLDVPNAAKILPTLVEKAKADGWLQKDFAAPAEVVKS